MIKQLRITVFKTDAKLYSDVKKFMRTHKMADEDYNKAKELVSDIDFTQTMTMTEFNVKNPQKVAWEIGHDIAQGRKFKYKLL